MVARALLVARARADHVGVPLKLAREPGVARPEVSLRDIGRPRPLAGLERLPSRPPTGHDVRNSLSMAVAECVAQRHRRAGRQVQRRSKRGHRPATGRARARRRERAGEASGPHSVRSGGSAVTEECRRVGVKAVHRTPKRGGEDRQRMRVLGIRGLGDGDRPIASVVARGQRGMPDSLRRHEVDVPVLEPGKRLIVRRGVADRHVMEQHRVVARRCIDVLVDRRAGERRAAVEVAEPERPAHTLTGDRAGVQRAVRPPVQAQVPVATAVVAVRCVVGVDPFVVAVLIPELHVTAVERVGHDVIVAELMPGVAPAAELGLGGLGCRQLIERVAVARQPKAIGDPTAE